MILPIHPIPTIVVSKHEDLDLENETMLLPAVRLPPVDKRSPISELTTPDAGEVSPVAIDAESLNRLCASPPSLVMKSTCVTFPPKAQEVTLPLRPTRGQRRRRGKAQVKIPNKANNPSPQILVGKRGSSDLRDRAVSHQLRKPETPHQHHTGSGILSKQRRQLASTLKLVSATRQPVRGMLKSLDWAASNEVALNFSGFPPNVTTLEIWKIFKNEGELSTIELFSSQPGCGKLRFSPPPASAFWIGRTYSCTIGKINKPLQVSVVLQPSQQSRNNRRVAILTTTYPAIMELAAKSLDFGFMYKPSKMMGMYKVQAPNRVRFRLKVLDAVRREIEVRFQLAVQDARQLRKAGTATITNRDFKFTIPLAQPLVMHQIISPQQSILLISMETPPNFYRKFDEASTHSPKESIWFERDTWFRQTDIVADPKKRKVEPVALKKTKPMIDIGRWTTYHFAFQMNEEEQKTFNQIRKCLRDLNIDIKSKEDFELLTERKPPVWDYIDDIVPFKDRQSSTALDDLLAEDNLSLSYQVRYQLEVCISEGWLNEHNITREFVDKLRAMVPQKSRELLEYVSIQKKRVFEPMEIFDIVLVRRSTVELKIPAYCTYVRAATVTPSMIYYSSPTVETSNRVVRQYSEYADHFLRVRFTDEKFQGRINSTDKENMNEVFTRIKRTMINGIAIGDRHFEFLAFGNSQFREHGAYFFSPLEHLSTADIRNWMGNFRDIKVVAKYAARLGLCFSTTRAIHQTIKIMETDRDVYTHDKEYCFTDGVGRISNYLAVLAADEVGVNMPNREPPSVFQFRLGGCKGILTVSPELKDRVIYIRPSQYKFPAQSNGLEIIRWSQFSAAHLNRQLIMVLSALGVPDSVFLNKLKEQLSNLERAMTDEKMALSLLQKEIDPNQMTLSLASMILDGFQTIHEPFIMSLLQLWRAWSIKYLKEKAKIVVHQGGVFFGCVDETATLKGHLEKKRPRGAAISEEDRLNDLPEIFMQVSNGADGKPQVIEGLMALARNPSLHPGDIRVVRGVDVPALHHLKDVVVLPQTGDRDISSMCSGGDLDGDDYIVIWDKDLLPPEWNHPPMNYTAPKPIEIEEEVTVDDITSFFVQYMKNDSLPTIAHAHVAWGDASPDGVKDPKCLELAALHSEAVDYVKTGKAARLKPDLRAKKWPHFMEKKFTPKENIYISKKVLGKIYDVIERVDFRPDYHAPFDTRILEAYPLDENTRLIVTELKLAYDEAMRRIMAQHAIRSEFEVWSTWVLLHANQGTDYKFHEGMGENSHALKDRFRTACFARAGGRTFDRIGPFAAAMYKVTNDEMQEALAECRQIKIVEGKEEPVRSASLSEMPLMSFPWLFPDILGKIATSNKRALDGIPDMLEKIAIGNKKVPNSIPPLPQLEVSINVTPKHRSTAGKAVAMDDENDVVQTKHGITHRGQDLILFDDDDGTDEQNQHAERQAPATSYVHNDLLGLDYYGVCEVVTPLQSVIESASSTTVNTPSSGSESSDKAHETRDNTEQYASGGDGDELKVGREEGKEEEEEVEWESEGEMRNVDLRPSLLEQLQKLHEN